MAGSLFLLTACSLMTSVSSWKRTSLMPFPKKCTIGPMADLDRHKLPLNGMWYELVITRLSTHNESRYLKNDAFNATLLAGGPAVRMQRFRSWSNEDTCDELEFTFLPTEEEGVLAATKDDGTFMYYSYIIETDGHFIMTRDYYPDLDESTYHLWSQYMCFNPRDVAKILNRISSDPCLREKKYVEMEHSTVCGMPPAAIWSEILQ
ncbi:uncharacterized protein LOC106150610 [Lingula anatina]|uniref:Uncharacterized protein LOC106150610 n=1 Tax=Lingula anatina TaxID=7574 RepID=A0A1S3H0G6_LINAN|nr:uncharacterized protein LOC106150610 [Lingula anatina]|eukprot:XP_013378971.1 uncharacterized protein LOC106150610 [Lingula anatina]